ncbi:hypothetical protein ABEB36_010709 [Hypothenemus hampei]|uniref:Myb/SANT-like DNA-binding domain-containing protein n=1 Tax=Hypothenemus hampei TaxID=57062 RepID=A0ABD1ECV4_HYPHA
MNLQDAENIQSIEKDQNNSFYWTVNTTKMLIDLFKKYKSQVGRGGWNFRCLWEIIAGEIANKIGEKVSSKHIENRWKVLERNYKKWTDHQNSTGRGRKVFEFSQEMESIYATKKNIHPEIVLSTDTEHIPLDVNNVNTISNGDKVNGIETKKSHGENLRRKSLKKRKSVLQEIRNDRLKYQEARLNFLQQAHKEIVEKLDERNKIAKEKNELLKKEKLNF